MGASRYWTVEDVCPYKFKKIGAVNYIKSLRADLCVSDDSETNINNKNERRHFMKKFLSFALTLCLCLCSVVLISCNGKGSKIEETESIAESTLTAKLICVKNKETNEEVQLSDSDNNIVMSIWNNTDWDDDVTKTLYDYLFIVDETTTIYYVSEFGLFNDWKNGRHCFVTDEQRTIIDNIIQQYFS